MFAGQTRFIYRVDARKLPALAGRVSSMIGGVRILFQMSELLSCLVNLYICFWGFYEGVVYVFG